MNDIQLLILSKYIPKSMDASVRPKMKKTMVDAGNSYQTAFISEMSSFPHLSIEIINSLPIGSYPRYFSEIKVPFSTITLEGRILGCNAGFNNLSGFKHISRYQSIKKLFKKWIEKKYISNQKRVIISYSLDLTFLKMMSLAKKIDSSIRNIVIVPDLPIYNDLSTKRPLIKRIFINLLNENAIRHYSSVDGFVFFTSSMNSYLNLNKPYVVIEGMVSTREKNTEQDEKCIDLSFPYILYSGLLHKKFGIPNLITAYCQIDNPKYKLVLCGIGDYVDEIVNISSLNDNIHYLGQLSRNVVLDLQKKASFVINPRGNDYEYSKFSFPSKTIEYMISGTPMIGCRLNGIPNDYYPYFIPLPDSSIESIYKTLIYAFQLDEISRLDMGREAKDYIEKYKNSRYQVLKILDFIQYID